MYGSRAGDKHRRCDKETKHLKTEAEDCKRLSFVENIVSAIGNNGLTRVERQTAGTPTVSVSRRTDAEISVL